MPRFLHISDLHVVADGQCASGVLDTRAILTSAVDRLLHMRPTIDALDAVLVSGDISDDGSADSYDFAKAELERLGLPFFVVPGNHDARDPMRAAFADLPTMPCSGWIDWATVVGETRIIGLDTLVEGQGGGRLREESLVFLHEELTAAGLDPVILMLHHPPLSTGIKFMDDIGLENAEALETTLSEAKGDVTVIAGHVHGVHLGRLGRHQVITAPAICSAFALDRRPDAPVGFYTAPTGCAVLDTSPGGIWSAIPLAPADGPFPF